MDYMRGGGGGYGGYGGGGGAPSMGGGGALPMGAGGGYPMSGGMAPMGMGMGGGPPAMMGGYGPPISFAEVSYDTSSNEPSMKASRVFVGNLNSSTDREELLRAFWRFGRIIGCTCFKGYAFIQFSSEEEARAAVMNMKGSQFFGQTIDVKLACEGKGGPATAKPSPQGGVKRVREDASGPTPLMSTGPQHGMGMGMGGGGGEVGGGSFGSFPPVSKRPMFGGGESRYAYQADTTPPHAIQRYEHSDTLICGNCDSVFRDWLAFREHRKEPCDSDALRKPADEPIIIKCFVCKEEFKHSWSLLQHLSSLHHLTVYIDDSNPDQSNGQGTSVKDVTKALKKE